MIFMGKAQRVLQQGERLAGKLRAEPATVLIGARLGQRHFGDRRIGAATIPVAARAGDRAVVQNHALIVARKLGIQLNQIKAVRHGAAKGGHGVFGALGAVAPVRLKHDGMSVDIAHNDTFLT